MKDPEGTQQKQGDNGGGGGGSEGWIPSAHLKATLAPFGITLMVTTH